MRDRGARPALRSLHLLDPVSAATTFQMLGAWTSPSPASACDRRRRQVEFWLYSRQAGRRHPAGLRAHRHYRQTPPGNLLGQRARAGRRRRPGNRVALTSRKVDDRARSIRRARDAIAQRRLDRRPDRHQRPRVFCLGTSSATRSPIVRRRCDLQRALLARLAALRCHCAIRARVTDPTRSARAALRPVSRSAARASTGKRDAPTISNWRLRTDCIGTYGDDLGTLTAVVAILRPGVPTFRPGGYCRSRSPTPTAVPLDGTNLYRIRFDADAPHSVGLLVLDVATGPDRFLVGNPRRFASQRPVARSRAARTAHSTMDRQCRSAGRKDLAATRRRVLTDAASLLDGRLRSPTGRRRRSRARGRGATARHPGRSRRSTHGARRAAVVSVSPAVSDDGRLTRYVALSWDGDRLAAARRVRQRTAAESSARPNAIIAHLPGAQRGCSGLITSTAARRSTDDAAGGDETAIRIAPTRQSCTVTRGLPDRRPRCDIRLRPPLLRSDACRAA